MKNSKTVDALNTLVEINNDRIEGYQTAMEKTKEQDLKGVFGQFAQSSYENKKELSSEIRSIGGTPTDETKNTGKLFRAWMDLKAAVTGNDRQAILNSCEFGEDNALDTYQDVLENEKEHLNPGHIRMINSQLSVLKEDHKKVNFLRDEVKAHS